MARYKLLADHYMFDRLLPAGTEIGDGTPWPFKGEPSMEMQGMDKASQDLINKRFAGLYSDPVQGLPLDDGQRMAPGPRLRQVGEAAPRPFGTTNPLVPSNDVGVMPVQPYAQEQVQPSAVARPDPSKSPEDRERDRDALAQQGLSAGAYAHPAPDPELTVSEGNQTQADLPLEPPPPPKEPPMPTLSGSDEKKSKK